MDKANTNTAADQIKALEIAKVTASFAGDWERSQDINVEIMALRAATTVDQTVIDEMEAGAAIRRANRIDPADAIAAQNARVEATNRTAMGRSIRHGLED